MGLVTVIYYLTALAPTSSTAISMVADVIAALNSLSSAQIVKALSFALAAVGDANSYTFAVVSNSVAGGVMQPVAAPEIQAHNGSACRHLHWFVWLLFFWAWSDVLH